MAVARSLASRGISVLAVDSDPRNLVFYSRSVKRALRSPSSILEPEAFLEFVLRVIRQYEIRLVIPGDDSSLHIFTRQRNRFERPTGVATASPEAIRRVLDKRINLEITRRIGIPCPRQFELTDLRQIPEMIRALGFPIVLKRPGPPDDPEVPAFGFRVLYARDEDELRRYITQHCREGVYPLFQECAYGVVQNLCCFAVRGEAVAIHQYQSIRRWEGNAVLRRIVELDEELAGHTRNLLRALEWDGVAHVAFFVSPDRRRKWHMETNGRFWASTEGSVHAGWDFPFWVYDYFVRGRRPEPGPIKIGSTTCWHRGDLTALLWHLRGGESATGAKPGKFRAVGQYVSGFSPGIHSDVFRWTDPLPSLVEHWQLGKRLWQVLKARDDLDAALTIGT